MGMTFEITKEKVEREGIREEGNRRPELREILTFVETIKLAGRGARDYYPNTTSI
jgi:hypothetical protein